ncbi:hypothetical protein FQA39_LY00334 [Lamprigera yunnana]|nr:hypothetical protein FQA39_LY00334 [Lamprigera yunnana]
MDEIFQSNYLNSDLIRETARSEIKRIIADYKTNLVSGNTNKVCKELVMFNIEHENMKRNRMKMGCTYMKYEDTESVMNDAMELPKKPTINLDVEKLHQTPEHVVAEDYLKMEEKMSILQ